MLFRSLLREGDLVGHVPLALAGAEVHEGILTVLGFVGVEEQPEGRQRRLVLHVRRCGELEHVGESHCEVVPAVGAESEQGHDLRFERLGGHQVRAVGDGLEGRDAALVELIGGQGGEGGRHVSRLPM